VPCGGFAQKLFAADGEQPGSGLPHWLFAALGLQFGGAHWLFAALGLHTIGGLGGGVVGVVHDVSFLFLGVHVGTGEGLGVPGPGVRHRVCAGFPFEMPLLPSHS
jgi:hypothetical protein